MTAPPPVPDWRSLAAQAPATALLSGTTLLWASEAARVLLDVDPGRLAGLDVLDLVTEGDRDRTRRALELARRTPGTSHGPFLVRLRARPATRLEVVSRARSGQHLVVAAWDVTERQERERVLGHRAGHDPLTGLPNRALLADRWERARSREPTGGRLRTFVLLCDVDGLKEVNDELGHRAGDALLVAVAHRLAAEVRPGDTVARLGGDEFVVLLEGVPAEHVQSLAERLRRTVSTVPLRTPVRLSVGWAADDPQRATEAVLGDADARMYADKRSAQTGRGRTVDVRGTAGAVDVRDGER